MPVLRDTVVFLQKSKINFVLVDRRFEDLETDYITADHYYGAFNAIDYLLNLGHRRIGVIKGPDHLFPHFERLANPWGSLSH